MPASDPELVREQYASEDNLRARQALYEEVSGENGPDVLLRALREWGPRRVLEVGGGTGELAERIVRELGATLSFVDQSERMVELAQARGLDAQVGDVRDLPFADGTFDTAVAAWMLYHVPDVDRALAELARVLAPGGALFAVTNSDRHLEELRGLIGMDVGELVSRFSSENGEALLRRQFAQVERLDIEREVTVREREKLVAYQQSLSTPSRPVPEDVALPFVVHARSSIFFATT
jgi:ubiquinone/menaquinone biosynthesis C-methylase UbiE